MADEKFIYARKFENINDNFDDRKNQRDNDDKEKTDQMQDSGYGDFKFDELWNVFKKNQNAFTAKNMAAILILANKRDVKKIVENYHTLYDDFTRCIKLKTPKDVEKNKDLASLFDCEKIKVRNIIEYVLETSFDPINKDFFKIFEFLKDGEINKLTSSIKEEVKNDKKTDFISKYRMDKEKFRQQTPKYAGAVDFLNEVKKQSNVDQTKISLGTSCDEKSDIAERHEFQSDATGFDNDVEPKHESE